MFCKKCGSEMSETALVCEKCGYKVGEQVNSQGNSSAPIQSGPVIVEKSYYNTMSIIGIVLGGISLFINILALIGLAALIVSLIGLIQVNQSHENGRAVAIIGIILGSFSTIYFVMSILFLF